MDRKGLLRRYIDLNTARVLEIGPLASPLVGPADARVDYVDHLDTDGLRRAYRGHSGVDPDAIVEITHVWSDGTFADAVGTTEAYDAIVSSHVFEHLPNPVQWLIDAHTVLAPGGQIYMVVPDMRFTFDRYRTRTRAGEWVAAYLEQRTRPGAGQIYDYNANVVHVPPDHGWAPEPDGGFGRVHDATAAMEKARYAAETETYLDAHCSVFTPASLLRLFAEIDALNLFPFEVAAVHPTEANDIEFAVVLRRIDLPPRPQLTREVDQALAREAGYDGAFGSGGFSAAMAADPGLEARHLALKRKWIRDAAAARGTETRVPALDPVLHDDWPAPDDPRLA